MPGPSDDARLLERIKARDTRALEQLYRKYRPRLAWFLSRRIARQQAIEDAIDETMLAVWTNPHSFRGACQLSTWLCAIAQRKALKSLRRYRGLPGATETDGSFDIEPSAEIVASDNRVTDRLTNAIGQLSAEQRRAIELAYFDGKPYREMSEILQCPVGTVKTRVYHAKRQLRQMLAGEIFDWV